MSNITPKQLAILTFIRDFRLKHGCSPTLDEIGHEMGITKVTAFEHVEALVRKNKVTRTPNLARSIELVVPDLPTEIARLREHFTVEEIAAELQGASHEG